MPVAKKSTHAIPLLSEEEIGVLAKAFADAIPEDELSVAALQGYLLKNKTRPRQCVEEVAEWVIQERETREKLKKEKAEVGLDHVPARLVLTPKFRKRLRRRRKPRRRRRKKSVSSIHIF